MLKNKLAQLKEPDSKYRGIPFWSWNDRLEPQELRRQIREMKEAGLGGYFMHARAGLRTPYMKEKWMECVEACVNEGEKQGLGSWIYDENGYPSGFAGGSVPAMGLEYQQKFLEFEILAAGEAKPDPATMGFFRTEGDYGRVELAQAGPKEQVLRVYCQVNPYYTDLLNEKAVAAFIESTYQVYYDRFAEEFGKGIPGIFTDEPQYGRTAMPWSLVLPDRFREKYGYELLENLQALYFETANCSKVRYDFWNLVTELFGNAYARQLSDWCREHGCKLTGHVLLEETLGFQTMCSGSAMGFYRHMQMPGIDWLGRATGNPVIVKQLSSVGEQLGKELVLSEMFAAAGWGTSLAELKKIAEWQYSLGVNLICAHLEAYSLRGLRKRDHPPGLFYQSNWWKEYKKFNDYFARLGMLLSSGQCAAGILVVHPLRSGWVAFDQSCYGKGENPRLAAIDHAFAELTEILTGLHLEYHYGDEAILAENGSIRDGEFVVGNCSYDTVIIPPSITLDRDTVRLLRGFIEGGGKVFAFEEFPYMVEGMESDGLKALKARCRMMKLDASDMYSSLGSAGCVQVSVRDGSGSEISRIYHKVSRYKDGAVVYLLNMDEKNGYEAEIEWKGAAGSCYRVGLEDCSITGLRAENTDGSTITRLTFAPSQSHMLIFGDGLQDGTVEQMIGQTTGQMTRQTNGQEAAAHEYGERLLLPDKWRVKPCDPNVLTLDYCRLSVDGSPWSELKPVIRIQQELLELGRDTDVAMEFLLEANCDFEPDFEKEEELFLAIEDADRFTVEINGRKVTEKAEGWWKDSCFGKVDIRGFLTRGTNSILLRTHFYSSPETLERLARAKVFEAEANMLSFDSEVESIYLVGNFEVASQGDFIPASRNALLTEGRFRLEKQKPLCCDGELTSVGYPFFTGRMLLEQEVEINGVENLESVLFRMETPHAAMSRLYVNGKEAATFLWPPCEAEILPFVGEGSNLLAIELVSTDRNLFGPHHHPDGELHQVGPVQYTDAGGWTDRYSFIRFGTGGKAELLFCRKSG